ncbi:tetraspanin-4-like [Acanthaster planci]|uniref:Tetraspanin n=1 Tax=Acanthaster planci TaxID=133434 RepID=A0A8B7XS65_ACAPL|nr:tetraspanin-4-like [Acanthaster planci]
MTLYGCANCVKYLLFAFNLLFFLSGGTVLAGGAYLFTREGPFATLLPSFPFLNAATLTMVVGGIMMLVSFLGCCGSIRENSCMVFTYFVLMTGILIAEMIAGGLGISNRNKVAAFVEQDMTQRGLPLYGTVGQQGLTTAWDRMQNFLLCCGVSNATDWQLFHPRLYGPGETPDSCCVSHLVGCGRNPLVEKWDRGCKDALIEELQRHIGAIGGIGIGVGVFQILGVVFAFILWWAIRNEHQGSFV